MFFRGKLDDDDRVSDRKKEGSKKSPSATSNDVSKSRGSCSGPIFGPHASCPLPRRPPRRPPPRALGEKTTLRVKMSGSRLDGRWTPPLPLRGRRGEARSYRHEPSSSPRGSVAVDSLGGRWYGYALTTTKTRGLFGAAATYSVPPRVTPGSCATGRERNTRCEELLCGGHGSVCFRACRRACASLFGRSRGPRTILYTVLSKCK